LPNDPAILATTVQGAQEYHRSCQTNLIKEKEFLSLSFWAAQLTAAAQLRFILGAAKPSISRLLLPATAALIIQSCYRRHCYVRTTARNYAAARTIQTRFRLVRHLFAEERVLESRLLATGTIQQWYRGIFFSRIAVLRRHILAKIDQLEHVADKSGCARVYAAMARHSLLQAMAYNSPRICLRLRALSIVLDRKVNHYLHLSILDEIAYYLEYLI